MKPQNLCIFATLLGLGLSGCEEGRKNPPDVSVTFVHAAPSVGIIGIRREEVLEANLDYRESTGGTFDADTYTFHFEVTPADEEAERPVSFDLELFAGTDYTIIATEIAGEFQQLVVEMAAAEANSTILQGAGLHLAPMLGPVDIYLVPADTDLLAATPFGSLSFGEDMAPAPVDAGEYELILTEAGNPGNVRLNSTPFVFPSGLATLFTLLDDAGLGFAPVAVTVSGGANLSFVDDSLESRIRIINGASGQSSVDIGIDGDLSPPLISGLAFGAISDYTTIPAGAPNLTVSPAGNPSVVEIDFPFSAAAGRFSTFLIAGPPGGVVAIVSADDYRQIAGEAKLNIYNAAGLFSVIDIFLQPPGTDLTGITPEAGLTPGGGVPNIPKAAGNYEITIREAGTENVLAGPTAVTLIAGGFYGILLTDAAGGATVDLTLFDDFN